MHSLSRRERSKRILSLLAAFLPVYFVIRCLECFSGEPLRLGYTWVWAGASGVPASRQGRVVATSHRALPLGEEEEEEQLERTRSQLRAMGFSLVLDAPPRDYFNEMRGTDLGNAFWRQKTDEKWGFKGVGDAGKFDLDDLVEAVYPDSGEWYSASVKKYIGNSEWIVYWLDCPEEGSFAQASVVKTKDMKPVMFTDIEDHQSKVN